MKRRLRPELMDQPGLDAAEHEKALAGLRRVNSISRTGAVLWPPIAACSSLSGGKPLRVLDLASGGGDVPIELARRAIAARRDIQFEGCDISPEAVRIAQGRADALHLPIRFSIRDALRDPIPDDFDVITCTLFLHHLSEEDAVRLLRKMSEAARRIVLVDDLIRGRWGYILAILGCHLLSSSRIVHFDGPVSVGGAYRPPEVYDLARRAGMKDAIISRHWPQRFLLKWDRP